MDVYHQVLDKLYEETGGKTGTTVNLMTLVKSLGLHGNYANIFEHLNVSGWIAESVKADFVVITLEGARQARKSTNKNSGGAQENKTEIARSLRHAANLARELAVRLEEQAENSNLDFAEATKKLLELQNVLAQTNLS